jgi:hypothetical protein
VGISGEDPGKRRSRLWLAVAGPLAAVVVAGACGSGKSPVSSKDPSTSATTTTVAASTTTAPAATTTTAPAGGNTKQPTGLAKMYLTIVTAADNANNKLAVPLEDYTEGKASAAQLTSAVDTYVKASSTFQANLNAVKWPAKVEAGVKRIIAKDRQFTAMLKQVPGLHGARLKTALDRLDKVLLQLKRLSNTARQDLGLPVNA